MTSAFERIIRNGVEIYLPVQEAPRPREPISGQLPLLRGNSAPLYRVEVAYPAGSHRSGLRCGTSWHSLGDGSPLPRGVAEGLALLQRAKGFRVRVVDSSGRVVWPGIDSRETT